MYVAPLPTRSYTAQTNIYYLLILQLLIYIGEMKTFVLSYKQFLQKLHQTLSGSNTWLHVKFISKMQKIN